MIFFMLIFLSFPVYAYDDMEKWPFCQDLLSKYSPEKIRDDLIDDINLRLSVPESEYIVKTVWHTDLGYNTAAFNRARGIGTRSSVSPEEKLKSTGHLDGAILESISCIAGLTNLSNIAEYLIGRFPHDGRRISLIQKDMFGTREEFLNYLWSMRDENWHSSGTRNRALPILLMQAGLEDKKFFDFVSPGIRSSYPHYIPMLEFFQRSTGLNHETLRQALRHEDYYVFEWAVKKISSQHITELYTELADAINQLIRITGRIIPDKSEMRKGKLRLFTQYRHLPFEDEVLVYEYTPHHFHPPPAWNLHPLPPNTKIKEEYKTRKSDKLY